MRITIERIEETGPDRKARRIVFADHEIEARTTSNAALRTLGLAEGSDFDRDEFEAALDAAEASCAHERALAIVGYRERSARELEKRLTDDGYPPGISRAIVDRFVELRFIDDERFAGMLARTRAGAGFGPSRVRDELRRKGVAPLIIDSVMAETFHEADTIDSARQVLRGKVAKDRKERDKLVRKLVSRGFSVSVALSATEPHDQDSDDPTS